MNVFIGHIRCPGCGFTHIVNPKQVTIYYNFDCKDQIAEVICFKCKQIVEGKIDDQDVFAFKARGVRLVPWQSRLSPLTEDEINNWDIEEELNSGIY